MPSAAATRASDKQQACKKLTSLLQKEYGKSVPGLDLPVLETMLFGICLEDNSWQAAQAGYDKLLKSFFDLNEIRVSSVAELEQALSDLHEADWKGLRIRALLRFVFEANYSFDYERLRRLTLESAQKRLKKIDSLSPFIRNFTLQYVLGCHLVCLDETMLNAAMYLGLVPPDHDTEAAGEFLKAGVKKSEVPAFVYLLRCLATDPKYAEHWHDRPEDEFDITHVESRFQELKKPARKKPAPKAAAPAKKKTTAAAPAKKSAGKSSAAADKAAPRKSTSAATGTKKSKTSGSKTNSKKTSARKK